MNHAKATLTAVRRYSLATLRLLAMFAVTSASIAVAATSQDDLVSALKIKYPITETTPDRSQISQPGILMRIAKNGISAQPWDTFITFDNPIADGTVQHHSRWLELAQSTGAKLGQSKNVLALKPGDTFYITRIESKSESKDDLLKISILSCDPLDVDDGASQKRYAATISFKMAKNALAESAPDQIEQMVEVVLQPDTGATGSGQTALRAKPPTTAATSRQTQSILTPTLLATAVLNPAGVLSKAALTKAAVSKAAAAQTARAPAQTNPASPTTTQNIAKGQTIQQVVTTMGQPQQIVDLGTKKIYTYPNLKIVFVNEKVSDVE